MPLQFFAQGINNLWCMGYSNQSGPPLGGFDMNYMTGTLTIIPFSRQINYGDVSATICNSSGQMFFSTNAVYIANALGDTMLNASGLSPSHFRYKSFLRGNLFLLLYHYHSFDCCS